MNRINWIQARSIWVCTIMILSFSLVGCAHMPDNFQFGKEVVNIDSQLIVKRVVLLDVPTPTGIWLGDPGSGAVAGLFGVGAAFRRNELSTVSLRSLSH